MTSTGRLLACRICRSSHLSEPIAVHEMMFGTREIFDYRRCADCGTLQIDRFPEKMVRHYPDSFYYAYSDDRGARFLRLTAKRVIARWMIGQPSRYPSGEGIVDAVKRSAEPWIALVPKLTLRSAILDVGCGDGTRLRHLRNLGFTNLHGIDPRLPESARDSSDACIELGRHELDETAGSYDLITFHHSLEHVRDPAAMLGRARSLLNDDGHILVRLPLLQPEIWEDYGTNWSQLDAPRHFYLFAEEGFLEMCRRAGLKSVRHGTDGQGWSLAWSEAYRSGVAMHTSDGRPNRLPFDAVQIAATEKRMRALNRHGKGDSGYFVLRRA